MYVWSKDRSKITYFCDHCGKVLDEENLADTMDADIQVDYHWLNAILCSECVEELWKMVNDFCTKQEREKQEG